MRQKQQPASETNSGTDYKLVSNPNCSYSCTGGLYRKYDSNKANTPINLNESMYLLHLEFHFTKIGSINAYG